MIENLDGHKVLNNKTRTKHRTPTNNGSDNKQRLTNYYNVPPQRNNLIKLPHYDETKKRAHDSQIIQTNKKLKVSHGGPSQIMFTEALLPTFTLSLPLVSKHAI